MNARRPRHLRDTRDGHFHIGGSNQHKVSQFVDDHDDVGKLFRDDNILVARDHDLLIHLNGKAVRPRLNFFLFDEQREFGLLRHQFLVGPFVERFHIAHADARENLVAFFHLVHHPAQREQNFLRIRDNRNHQMWQRVVLLKFNHLGVNHHEPHLIRREPVKQRSDDGINADGFARTRAAGDKAVRHFRKVGDDRMPIDILAQGDRNARLGIAPFIRFKEVAHDDLGLDEVWHFDAHRTFSGDRRKDMDTLSFERGGEIVAQVLNLLELYARGRVQLVTGDRRAFGNVTKRHLYIKLRKRLLHEPRISHQFLLGLRGLHRHIRMLEKIHGRQLVLVNHRHGRHSHGFGLLGQRFGP